VAAVLRAHGGGRLVLAGASKGAKVSLVTAASLSQALVGVLSLSAEAVLAPATQVLGYIHAVPCPILLLSSSADPYGSADAGRAFLSAAVPHRARLVLFPGDAHGVDLLSGPTAPQALGAVDDFLRGLPG
jgi:dienelactone hydrolase